ncbi:MAG: MFS transporter [Kineosporiaceae bacterium]
MTDDDESAGGPSGEGTSPQTPPAGWLTRNLTVLSGVSFLQDAATELLYPILPIFLTTVLGAPVAIVGAVEGIAEGVAAVTKLGAGALADRYRRRPLIGVGYGLAALGKVLIAVATIWPVVLLGRVVDRLGKGVRGAPRDALLVEGIPVEARGRAFGLHRTADTLGAVVGPLLGLGAYELLDHQIRPLLVVAVVPAVLSVLLVGATRERRKDTGPGPGPARTSAGSATDTTGSGWPRGTLRGLPRPYWRVVAILAGFSLVNFPDALLLLRLNEIGFSVRALILAYVTYNVVYAAASYPAGALSDRLPRQMVFGIGLLFFAVGYLGLGLVRNHVAVWLLLAAYGLFGAFTDGVGKGWISSMVDGEHQARAQGAFQAATGLAVLLAGVWAGLAWGENGRVPLLVSGGVGAVTALVLLATAQHRLPRTPGHDGRVGSSR